jgi:hypothetical protein
MVNVAEKDNELSQEIIAALQPALQGLYTCPLSANAD